MRFGTVCRKKEEERKRCPTGRFHREGESKKLGRRGSREFFQNEGE